MSHDHWKCDCSVKKQLSAKTLMVNKQKCQKVKVTFSDMLPESLCSQGLSCYLTDIRSEAHREPVTGRLVWGLMLWGIYGVPQKRNNAVLSRFLCCVRDAKSNAGAAAEALLNINITWPRIRRSTRYYFYLDEEFIPASRFPSRKTNTSCWQTGGTDPFSVPILLPWLSHFLFWLTLNLVNI